MGTRGMLGPAGHGDLSMGTWVMGTWGYGDLGYGDTQPLLPLMWCSCTVIKGVGWGREKGRAGEEEGVWLGKREGCDGKREGWAREEGGVGLGKSEGWDWGRGRGGGGE